MAKVFISYRRADSATFTGRIYDRLIAKFGRKNVFKDVDNIPPGANFAQYIQDSLRQCAVELVIIGPHWLDTLDAQGNRRLDIPNDFVRLEVEAAQSLGLIVIPLLVDGATIPTSANLPESLRSLAMVNAIVVRNDPDFARDMDRVIAGVERGFASRPSSGLFGRSRTAGPRNQPTPIRPQSPVASDGPTSSSSTPAQAAPKPAAHSSIGKPPEAPNETSLSGLARVRRSLIAGLVVVGVVVSFAIILSQGASRGQGLFSSGAPTPTVTATATEMITATATDQPLFADSLDTPNSNWIDWGDFYTCQASFVNNVLEFKAGGAQGPSGQGCVVRGRSFTDMTLQVQMTFKGGVGQVGGGLIYRGNFFFEVYRDGTFAVMDWRSTPRLDLVRNSSAAINTQLGATNTLSVSVHGTLGEYFVNGQRVAQVSDLPIISGAVGVSGAQIGAASNISIEDFQNFIVRE